MPLLGTRLMKFVNAPGECSSLVGWSLSLPTSDACMSVEEGVQFFSIYWCVSVSSLSSLEIPCVTYLFLLFLFVPHTCFNCIICIVYVLFLNVFYVCVWTFV